MARNVTVELQSPITLVVPDDPVVASDGVVYGLDEVLEIASRNDWPMGALNRQPLRPWVVRATPPFTVERIVKTIKQPTLAVHIRPAQIVSLRERASRAASTAAERFGAAFWTWLLRTPSRVADAVSKVYGHCESLDAFRPTEESEAAALSVMEDAWADPGDDGIGAGALAERRTFEHDGLLLQCCDAQREFPLTRNERDLTVLAVRFACDARLDDATAARLWISDLGVFLCEACMVFAQTEHGAYSADT
jgi:hypothetical protein